MDTTILREIAHSMVSEEDVQNGFHIFCNILNVVADQTTRNKTKRKRSTPFDLYFSVLQIVLFFVWTILPIKEEWKKKHYSKIRFAIVVSSIVPFALEVYNREVSSEQTGSFETYKPWLLLGYHVVVAVAYEYKRYRTRKSVLADSDPSEVVARK